MILKPTPQPVIFFSFPLDYPLTEPLSRALIEKPLIFHLLLNETCLFDLGVEELLQYIGTLVVLALRSVVFPAVGEDALHVGHEKLPRCVVPALQALAHRLKVCG